MYDDIVHTGHLKAFCQKKMCGCLKCNGDLTQIAEVAEQYKHEQSRLSRHIPTTPAEELADIVNAVVHYEKKYGGQYEHTLANKAELTPEEQRDAHEWQALIREIEEKRW